ncbi:MAG: TonB-dependent receptor plug domain-containing protein, partial [Sideroxyarcus sp.]|nr:TonB-dependent receptor plug domain-containing protein [Sideroxyarcus sp.]
MQTLKRKAICALLFAAWSGVSFAQTTEEEDLALAYGDQTTISIATGSIQTLRRAPSVASIVTAEDILTMGATDLDEVLETVAGMHVSRSAVDYTPLYVIRGIFSANNPQTLMLQNGIPTTTMFTGSKGNIWGGLPVENIARIEILRGPGSALYGADAYAGIINIITKTASDTRGTRFEARGGSFNTRNAWIQHGGHWGPMEVAAYLRVGSTDGHKQTITADAQSARDNKTPMFTNASLAPGSVNTGSDGVDGSFDLAYDQWRLRTGYKLRSNVGTGAGIASALDPVGKSRSERITADLSWTAPQISQDWGTGLTASYLGYSETLETPFVLYPAGAAFSNNTSTYTFPDGMIGAPEKWERDIRLSAFVTYAGFSTHQIRFGIGHDDLNMYRTAERKNFTLSPLGLPIPQASVT